MVLDMQDPKIVELPPSEVPATFFYFSLPLGPPWGLEPAIAEKMPLMMQRWEVHPSRDMTPVAPFQYIQILHHKGTSSKEGDVEVGCMGLSTPNLTINKFRDAICSYFLPCMCGSTKIPQSKESALSAAPSYRLMGENARFKN